MKLRFIILPIFVTSLAAALPLLANAQSSIDSTGPSAKPISTNRVQPDLTYDRPTQGIRIHNYAFQAFGPLPIGIAAVEAGIDQEDNSLRNGNRARQVTAGDSDPTSAPTWSVLRRVMRCQKPSEKTRSTTAATVEALFRGLAMP